MSMYEWAKNEVEIACKKENPDRKQGEWDYGCACYESALKAYKLLMEDEHSGMSFGFTRNILKRLLDEMPLTPVEDTPDVWDEVADIENKTEYRCKRKFSLFKTVNNETGEVAYNDVDRVICIDDRGGSYTNGFISRQINKLYPIKMPYYPTGRYYVYVTDFDMTAEVGCFDTICVEKVKLPDGEVKKLNLYYKEDKYGFVEIGEDEYKTREAVYLANKKKLLEDKNDKI